MPAFRPHGVAVIGLVMMVALAHGGAVRNGFLYDDFHLIVENPVVRTHDWSAVWTSADAASADRAGRNFRPVTMSTYLIDHVVGGDDPRVFHAAQLAWHLVVVLCVYGLGWTLWRRLGPALALALLVALHPAQTEAVHYLSARSSILASLGMVVAFWTYLLAGGVGRLRPFAFGVSVAAFALACLSKESAIVFIVWIAAYEMLIHRARPGDLVGRLAPYLGVSAAVWAAHHLQVSGVWSHGASIDGWDAAATGATVLARHLWIWVMPLGIEPVSPQPWVSWMTPAVAASVAVCTAWGLAAAALRVRAPLAAFGLVSAGAALMPALWLPFITNVALFQPHRGYQASMGFALATVELTRLWGPQVRRGMERFITRMRGFQDDRIRWGAGAFLGVVMVLGTAGINAVQGKTWRHEVAFWSSAVRDYPHEAAYHHSLGAALLRAGDLRGARDALLTAERWDPLLPRLHFNLGIVLTRLKLPDEAIAAYGRAIERDPGDVKSWANLGRLYEGRGDLERAATAYRAALALDPGATRVREGLERLTHGPGAGR
ncbi:MAG: tetratricopeptide repeat protein [Nitrospiria bacterium]